MAKTKAGAAKKAEPSPHTLSARIREVIAARELTAYAVGQLADVDATVVSRFLSGERDIRLETADRIALALGIRAVEVATTKPRKKK